MKPRFISSPLFVLILFLVLACSSHTGKMKVQSDYNPMANFNQIKTYDFSPGISLESKNPKVNAEFVDARVRKAVEEQMAKKKLEKSSGAYPDVWIDYQAFLSKGEKVKKSLSLDIRDLGEGNEIHRTTIKFDKGTLVLSVINPKTQKPIWWGSAQAKLDMEVTWKEREARINRAVSLIMKDFPPE